MPGEAYVQLILNQLNGIAVRGEEDITRMLNAIKLLERLKTDIVDHKEPETVEGDPPEQPCDK